MGFARHPGCGVERGRVTLRVRTALCQRGYAYLMTLFLVTAMVIATAAAIPNLLLQGRREREAEMIWRGEQYERGIRLYFHKFGRYPQSVEQLTKQQNGIRFMRKAYKDPMNAEDGSWRFIYVTPAGQLIGSVRYTSLTQMALAERPGGAPPGVLPAGASGTPEAPPGAGGESQQNPSTNALNPSENPSETPQNLQIGLSSQGQPQASSQPGGIQGLSTGSEQPQPLQPSGPVFGGSIIGIGSTVEKPSLKVYKGGKTYKRWEFIWNPLAEAAISVQSGGVPGATPVGQPNPRQQPTPPGPTAQPQYPPPPQPEPMPPEPPEPEPPQL